MTRGTEIDLEAVKDILREHKSLPPSELVELIVKAGMSDSEARRATWQLLDRGEIEVDKKMRLTLREVAA